MSMITERPVSNPAGQSPVGATEEAPGRSRNLRVVLAAYLTLTKPRIVELLLVTTVPAMMLAHGGMPSLWLVAVVLVGGSLAAGAASVLNCYLDRDIDQVMRRTKRRPLPAHTVTPRNALIFGLVLAVVSLAIMVAFTNLLAAGLTLAAILYYDVVYTLWLKRTTVTNTFWGGACGAAPVLIGWAAVTGSLSPMAWALFAVVFFWQLPHFYPLAMKYKDDYARAGIPMLPVVASVRRVNAEIVLFAWLTVLTSLGVWALGLSPIYGVPTLVVGAIFIIEAHKLAGRASRGEAVKPMRLFHWSTTYLTIVFAAAALDALL
ncbi:protoheme IX farnesyltransferase [Micromonospora sonchi]|uniref:Protoheme IX farnesyltransferase n=1 Tax=Micromonospora sonchi TaxID=1763543 RepID=A0A917U611_9ACTN|nr:heme o synthase [Micromonospora sonchi]GGM61477.1 protoheme IX farnesyltransferase [Micromonospora sonchi]